MKSALPQPLSVTHQSSPMLPDVSGLAMTRQILDVPRLYQTLHRRKTIESRCLRFIILTVCRPGEVVELPPAEISGDYKLWTLGKGRRKHKSRHSIPLVLPAQWLVRGPLGRSEYPLFQKQKGGPLPLLYLNRELAAVGFGEARIYDVRPSFKRWAELRGVSADDIARVLGMPFVEQDLNTHRKLLERWAEYCMSSR